MATVEDQLAAALNTVDGLDAKPYRPRVLAPGVAWPEWTGSLPLTDCTFDETFDCLIVLPANDPSLTASRRRSLIAAVMNALRNAGAYITGSAPVFLQLDTPTTAAVAGPPGLRVSIRITTEEYSP